MKWILTAARERDRAKLSFSKRLVRNTLNPRYTTFHTLECTLSVAVEFPLGALESVLVQYTNDRMPSDKKMDQMWCGLWLICEFSDSTLSNFSKTRPQCPKFEWSGQQGDYFPLKIPTCLSLDFV